MLCLLPFNNDRRIDRSNNNDDDNNNSNKYNRLDRARFRFRLCVRMCVLRACECVLRACVRACMRARVCVRARDRSHPWGGLRVWPSCALARTELGRGVEFAILLRWS